jgi:mRNA interferase MazF
VSEPQRGEVWLVELDPTRGMEIQKTRPAVVISSNVYARLPLRIVVPVTTWQPRFAAWPYMIPSRSRRKTASRATPAPTCCRCAPLPVIA